ncbi:MAG: leucyl aminopeptidase family protein [Clostridiales bacterium]|nr:leucyl aminopeptidase family protein [Clostridiales bacterium]
MRIQISNCPIEKGKTIALETTRDISGLLRRLGKERGEDCQILADGLALSKEELEAVLETAACALYDGAYRLEKEALRGLKGEEVYEKRDELTGFGETVYTFVTSQLSEEEGEKIIGRGAQIGLCKGYARTLGNLPNNYLHTEDLAVYAEKLCRDVGISCEVLKDQELEELGCGGLLAVNQGSRREAAMVVLRYEGAPGEKIFGLVGKGLMFDAGGYHLKSIDGMKGMKFDMCGAAGILETMEILARRKVKKNLIAVLMLAENVISPDALKMGDVVTTLAGKTVEVYNTDAEGRLVLCDGITYVQNQGAKAVLDLATLTYSAQAALGDVMTGLFVNQEETCADWQNAAKVTGEGFWRMPLDETYHRMLEWSICADFANYAPGKGAGASVAACFLENFVEEKTPWVHLDMVGPSVVRSETAEMAEGASGAGISTIVRFVEQYRWQ